MGKIDELIQQYCPDGVEYKPLGKVCLMERGTSATKGTMQSGEIPVISGGRQPSFYCNQSNRTGETITVAGSGAGAGYVQYWNEPIFVCDAFSIKGSDNIITGLFLDASKMPEVSFVYPRIKDCPAVKTGVV